MIGSPAGSPTQHLVKTLQPGQLQMEQEDELDARGMTWGGGCLWRKRRVQEAHSSVVPDPQRGDKESASGYRSASFGLAFIPDTEGNRE